MRIAARWIGWYSLTIAVAGLLTMVLSLTAALWLDRPQRLSKSDRDLVDLIRAINDGPPGSVRCLCKVEHLR